MKLLDLFSGIGGFSLAAQRVYGEVEGGFSEIDKYASIIYKKHFNHTEYGNITTIRERELPGFDIVTFGFPCQDLSIAGKRTGFKGARSSLFFEAIRIINAVRPKYFIFENVKGLYSSHGGKDFTTVLRTITDIGYDGQWQLINTKWFLPQNRERIFFVGHLRGEPRPEIFPIKEPGGESCKDEEGDYTGAVKEGWGKKQNDATYIAQTIDANYHKGIGNQYRTSIIEKELNQIGTAGNSAQGGRIYDGDGLAKCLAANGGGMGAKTGLYQITTAQPRCGDPKRGGTGELSSSEYCFTIDTQPHIVNKIRRLTPIECERLQGFPDNWTEGISDTQRYKCLGNAITVNVAEEIFKRLPI